MSFSLPTPLAKFFSHFPIYTHPTIERSADNHNHPTGPTLWVLPPDNSTTSLLSSDIECLKWQAYIALRPRDISEGGGLKNVRVSWDVSPSAGVEGALPTLCVRKGSAKSGVTEWKFLGPKGIADWVDGPVDAREEDVAFKDEMEAWVHLLEGDVHDALITLNDSATVLENIRDSVLPGHSKRTRPVKSRTAAVSYNNLGGMVEIPFSFPSAPTSFEIHQSREQYREAIKALSARLGGDEWFLGSRNPTALDARAFAYLYKALYEADKTTEDAKWIRRETWKYVNLVRWESKVKKMVESFYQ